MGVTVSILSLTAIQSKASLAEALIKQAVPTYAAIVLVIGDNKTFLESACIAQLCALLCPGMPNRIKVSETSETGYAFRLKEVDWEKKKAEFDSLIKDFTNLATGGEMVYFSPLGVVVNDRPEI